MYGNGSFHDFYKKNTWANAFLPNKIISERLANLNQMKKPLFTTLIEKTFNNKVGDYIDTFFLKITYKKWKIKFKNLEEHHFNIAMKSTKNVSKHHPQNFQRQVIERLNEKYIEYQEKHNIYLPKEHA